jgi:hypothetical protein
MEDTLKEVLSGIIQELRILTVRGVPPPDRNNEIGAAERRLMDLETKIEGLK